MVTESASAEILATSTLAKREGEDSYRYRFSQKTAAIVVRIESLHCLVARDICQILANPASGVGRPVYRDPGILRASLEEVVG